MPELIRALAGLAPSIIDAIRALVVALKGGDELAARRAFEAALRLQFEARQAARAKGK